MNDNQMKLKNLLTENLSILDASQSTLVRSFEKCKKIGIKQSYSFEELESFDSLTSKYARTSDIFTQKVLITLFKLVREDAVTFLDRANLAEKLSLVTSADDLITLRDLRNQIAHEYKQEKIEQLFEDVLGMIEQLVSCLELTRKYISRLDKKV
jgi:hypothetical protein